MKKYQIMLAIILSTVIINSCKKNSTSAAPASPAKDYAASIKDKTWWGVLTYPGKIAEYYSVYFRADKSLVWSQIVGDYEGVWSTNGKQLTISFPTLIEIKAEISETDKLVNITDNSPGVEINSGELVANPDIPLDNTVWKGNQFGGGGSKYTLEMKFYSPLRLEATTGMMKEVFSYKRSPSGGTFRATTAGGRKFFGVIQSGTQMKGSLIDSDFPWEAAKQ